MPYWAYLIDHVELALPYNIYMIVIVNNKKKNTDFLYHGNEE